MPRYKKVIDRLIELDEVQLMLNRAKTLEHKVLVALLYLTGARPAEILELKARDFQVVLTDLQIRLLTKKGGYSRLLPLNIELTPYVKDLIIPWVESMKDPDSRVFTFHTTTRIQQIIYETSEGALCPYNFRHNRLTKMAMSGANMYELMAWKGAKDSNSVKQYLFQSPNALQGLKDKVR